MRRIWTKTSTRRISRLYRRRRQCSHWVRYHRARGFVVLVVVIPVVAMVVLTYPLPCATLFSSRLHATCALFGVFPTPSLFRMRDCMWIPLLSFFSRSFISFLRFFSKLFRNLRASCHSLFKFTRLRGAYIFIHVYHVWCLVQCELGRRATPHGSCGPAKRFKQFQRIGRAGHGTGAFHCVSQFWWSRYCRYLASESRLRWLGSMYAHARSSLASPKSRSRPRRPKLEQGAEGLTFNELRV